MAPRRALIVDDSTSMRKSLIYALQRIPELVCVEAKDGVEGLKRFAEAAFDVVLTDINMPLMDGLKLIRHIRSDPARENLPVVVITTEAAEADRERALALGANAYLVKPVRAQVVLKTVKGLLGFP